MILYISSTGRNVRSSELNVDFGECLNASLDDTVDCPMLDIQCQNQAGVILSPDFPLEITNENLFGKVLN